MMGMAGRVLVTGAQGFIGSACLPDLLSRGFEVHAVASPLQAAYPRNCPTFEACRSGTERIFSTGRPSALFSTVRDQPTFYIWRGTSPGHGMRPRIGLG